jgi:PEP-CTERM motif
MRCAEEDLVNMRFKGRFSSRFCVIALAVGICSTGAFAQGLVYDNIPANPSTLAGSIGYAANGATQFGGIITPDYSVFGNNIFSATVELANFATLNTDSATYNVPMTLTLYNVNLDGSVGSAFASSGAVNEQINFAPTSSGDMQQVVIPIAANGAPGTFIYGLSFTPTGPSASLNFAGSESYDLNGNYDPFAPADTTTVGATLAYACQNGPSQSLPSTNYCDTGYWDTPFPAFNNNPGTGFRQDFAFLEGVGAPGAGLIAFAATATPEPATLGLIGLGLMAFAAVARKKNRS